MQRYYLFLKILQAIYRFLSNIMIVIEYDDNFYKSSQVFTFDTITEFEIEISSNPIFIYH